MVSQIAETYGLEQEIADVPHLDFACTFPAQAGLDFELWLTLSDDEVTFGGAGWFADIFPADDPEKFEIIAKSFEGFINRNSRVRLYTAIGRKTPYWSVVELLRDGKWTSVSTGWDARCRQSSGQPSFGTVRRSAMVGHGRRGALWHP